MKIEVYTVGSFAMNSYLAIDTASGEAVFIDPGMESERLIEKAEASGARIKYILNTHCHIDHSAEIARVIAHFNVPYLIHREEEALLRSLKDQGDFFGVAVSEIPARADYVKDKDIIKIGSLEGMILHTPGHSPGGIALHIAESVFVGDALFYESIGRTDLPGGDYSQLIQSIQSQLLTLPDSTTVYPGHGPATTIGWEKSNNPFLVSR